jgi:hypothetical protein
VKDTAFQNFLFLRDETGPERPSDVAKLHTFPMFDGIIAQGSAFQIRLEELQIRLYSSVQDEALTKAWSSTG